jgi:RimJ/RimL family protein N-acetyltransferase
VSTKADSRGQVAVVIAHSQGPYVHFIDSTHYEPTPQKAMISSMRRALAIWGKGSGTEMSFPFATWIQDRPGVWSPA